MKTLLHIQQIRPATIKVTPQCSDGDEALARELISAFIQADKKETRWFVLDLSNVLTFTTDFIVLLLELTARTRRRGGELAVLNIQTAALEDLLTFNAKKYLTVKHSSTLDSPQRDRLENLQQRTATESATPQPTAWDMNVSRIEMAYDEDSIYLATDLAIRESELIGFTANEISRIKIATYEACLNAIQHTRTARAQAKIMVEVERMKNGLQICVIDFGKGFQVEAAREYNVTEAAQKGRTGGMGLHIIRRAMDVVDYKVDPLNGNTLKMIKYLKS